MREKKILHYELRDVEPYISWLYFFHAWGLSGKPREEKEKIQKEAFDMLHGWQGKYHTHAIFALFDANADEDDILIYSSDSQENTDSEKIIRFPMLRQQHPTDSNAPNLCLADYLRPVSQGKRDKLGVFCTTVDSEIVADYRHDEYLSMMAQTLCDRLAEATAEKLTQEIYSGIRPAVGYPSLPDTSANFILDQLIDMKQVGIRLTETGMMIPHASVSGLMFAHPQAKYFELGTIGEDQLRNYAQRRKVPMEMMKKFLQANLLNR